MKRYIPAVLITFLWILSAHAAIGHDVIDVKNGATLKGTVTVKDGIPKDESIVIDRDTKQCGKEQYLGKYIIRDSRVKNVVVWIDNITEGKAIPRKQVDISIKDCKAEPLVSVGFVGGDYLFSNHDDIFHTLQLKLELAYQEKVSQRPLEHGATIYNLAFPIKDKTIKRRIKKYHRYTDATGFIRVMSNTHNWIRGFIFVFDHPYAAVTDGSGTFVMEDLPPGDYVLKVWHEGLGMREQTIRVASNETKEITIEFTQ